MPDGDRYLWVHRRAPARGRGPGRGGAPRVIGRRPASPLLVRDANRKARSVGSGPGQVVVLSRYAARSLPLAGQAGLTTIVATISRAFMRTGGHPNGLTRKY